MPTALENKLDLAAMEALRAKLGLELNELAAIIGVDQATLYRWRKRVSRPRGVYLSQLVQLSEMFDLLHRLFAGPDLARTWLRTATPASLGGNVTPMQVLLERRIDRVLNTLHFVARGA